jgi:radical SAM protein with 4Fe4S-binding SPASM domain
VIHLANYLFAAICPKIWPMLKYQELRNAPRVELSQAVPLPAPFTIFVEPTNVCNFRCGFCPESSPDYQQQAGYYQRIRPIVYYRLLEELKAWTRLKSLKFYDLGEPLLNPELPEMIHDAYRAGVAERMELTTNGSIMNEDLARRLVRSGVDYIRVSVYGATDEGYQETTASRYTASKVRANVQLLRQVRDSMGAGSPHIFARFLAPNSRDADLFREQYTGIADEIGLEYLHNWGGTDQRLVNIGDTQSRVRKKQACPHPFYSVTVKASGDVSACCLDWNGQLKIGNLNESTLRQIWAGVPLRQLQAANLGQRRHEIPACRDCDLIHQFPDDLDGLSEAEFLERSGHAEQAPTEDPDHSLSHASN